MRIYRHGDVLIRQIAELPKGERSEVTTTVLAEGEATGHKHRLTCAEAFAVMQGFEEKKYFELRAPATLTHEEHSALSIEPGAYEIGIETEFDYFEEAMRRVVD